MSSVTSDPTLGTTSTIGRYFGIVSVVPSLFFAIWLFVLLASRPWAGPPSAKFFSYANPFTSGAVALGLVLVSLVIAVVMHPLQFLGVQILEGYWGTSRLALIWQTRMIAAQLRRRRELERTISRATDSLDDLRAELGLGASDRLDWTSAVDKGTVEVPLTLTLAEARARTALALYPELHSNVMPTRLGNVLRRYEALAGSAVGLDVIKWANHIGMVAEPGHTTYLQDQRNSMDLAVRMAVSCSGAFLVTFAMLWPWGAWLSVALLPLAGAWLSYRGSIIAADGYGRALTAWLQLNRFKLYEALKLPPPLDADEERNANARLDDLILGQPEYSIRYGPHDEKDQGSLGAPQG